MSIDGRSGRWILTLAYPFQVRNSRIPRRSASDDVPCRVKRGRCVTVRVVFRLQYCVNMMHRMGIYVNPSCSRNETARADVLYCDCVCWDRCTYASRKGRLLSSERRSAVAKVAFLPPVRLSAALTRSSLGFGRITWLRLVLNHGNRSACWRLSFHY